MIRREVQKAIRPLPHIANALLELRHQRLAPDGESPLVHDHVVELFGAGS